MNRKKYPSNWADLRKQVLKRAKNRCEFCGVQNHAVGHRDKEGRFCPTYGNQWHDAAGRGELSYKEAKETADLNNEDTANEHFIIIVLTIAHLDHDPENHNVSMDRLRALCQKCHNKYDMPNRVKNRQKKKGQANLFL